VLGLGEVALRDLSLRITPARRAADAEEARRRASRMARVADVADRIVEHLGLYHWQTGSRTLRSLREARQRRIAAGERELQAMRQRDTALAKTHQKIAASSARLRVQLEEAAPATAERVAGELATTDLKAAYAVERDRLLEQDRLRRRQEREAACRRHSREVEGQIARRELLASLKEAFLAPRKGRARYEFLRRNGAAKREAIAKIRTKSKAAWVAQRATIARNAIRPPTFADWLKEQKKTPQIEAALRYVELLERRRDMPQRRATPIERTPGKEWAPKRESARETDGTAAPRSPASIAPIAGPSPFGPAAKFDFGSDAARRRRAETKRQRHAEERRRLLDEARRQESERQEAARRAEAERLATRAAERKAETARQRAAEEKSRTNTRTRASSHNRGGGIAD
jgi:hypothetical protein